MYSKIFITPLHQKTWYHFKDFWRDKCHLKEGTAIRTGQFGYGMSADDTISNIQMEQSVAQFAADHNATQSTIANLTSTNSQLQQQLQQMQIQMASQEAHIMYQVQYQQQPVNHNNNINNNGNNNNY